MPKPWRWWVTGGAAAVLAAAAQGSVLNAEMLSKRSSRHSLNETARRIERAAREHGMPVFAKLTPLARPAAMPEPEPTLMLVLGTDDAHTPVVQATEDAALQLPLTVWVRSPQDRGTEVQFSDSRWLAEHEALPPELADQVAALPALIDAAIKD